MLELSDPCLELRYRLLELTCPSVDEIFRVFAVAHSGVPEARAATRLSTVAFDFQ